MVRSQLTSRVSNVLFYLLPDSFAAYSAEEEAVISPILLQVRNTCDTSIIYPESAHFLPLSLYPLLKEISPLATQFWLLCIECRIRKYASTCAEYGRISFKREQEVISYAKVN